MPDRNSNGYEKVLSLFVSVPVFVLPALLRMSVELRSVVSPSVRLHSRFRSARSCTYSYRHAKKNLREIQVASKYRRLRGSGGVYSSARRHRTAFAFCEKKIAACVVNMVENVITSNLSVADSARFQPSHREIVGSRFSSLHSIGGAAERIALELVIPLRRRMK